MSPIRRTLVVGKLPAGAFTIRSQASKGVLVRVINAGSDTAYRFAIGGHQLRVTHSDRYAVVPVTVDTLIIEMGEGYDVLVEVADCAHPLVATYVRNPAIVVPASQGGKTMAGSMLTLFAVGCPICNKLVVMAVGVSGALSWFAPIQPVLAVGSLGLLIYALRARRRSATECRIQLQPSSTV